MRRVWLDLVGGSLKALGLAVLWVWVAGLWPEAAPTMRTPVSDDYQTAALTRDGTLLVGHGHRVDGKYRTDFRTLAGTPVAEPDLAENITMSEPPARRWFVQPLKSYERDEPRWFIVATPDRRGCGVVAYGAEGGPDAHRRLAWFDRRGFATTPPRRADLLPGPEAKAGAGPATFAWSRPYTADDPGPQHEVVMWLLQGDMAQELLLTRRALGERLTLPGARLLGARDVGWLTPRDKQKRAAEPAVVLRSDAEVVIHVRGHAPDRRVVLPPDLRERKLSFSILSNGSVAAIERATADGQRTYHAWTLRPDGGVARHETTSFPDPPRARRQVEANRPLAATCPLLVLWGSDASQRESYAYATANPKAAWAARRAAWAQVWVACLVCSLLLAGHTLLIEWRRGRREWHWALLAGWGVPGWLIWLAHRPRPRHLERGGSILVARPHRVAPLRALFAKELRSLAWPAGLLVLAGLLLGTWASVIRPARYLWAEARYSDTALSGLTDCTSFLMLLAALALGSWQTLAESRAGTWAWLLARPVSRRRVAAVKMATGIGLAWLVGVLPLALADLWCRVPGHVPGPYYSGLLASGWLALASVPLAYSGAVLAGVRYRRVLSLWPLALLSALAMAASQVDRTNISGIVLAWWAAATIAALWAAGHAITTLDLE